MRTTALVASLSLVLSTVLPSASLAEIHNGKADARCWSAVVNEARNRFAADRVDQLSLDESQYSNAETQVTGSGQTDNGTRFNWSCLYNDRTNQTYGVSVTATGSNDQHAKKDHSGAVVAAILLAAGAAAVAANNKKHHDKDDTWWSPAGGVQCSDRERACYKSGSYSARWTDKEY